MFLLSKYLYQLNFFLQLVGNHFIHKDTENFLDILFGDILKENLFSPDFYPSPTSTCCLSSYSLSASGTSYMGPVYGVLGRGV